MQKAIQTHGLLEGVLIFIVNLARKGIVKIFLGLELFASHVVFFGSRIDDVTERLGHLGKNMLPPV